MMTYIYVTKMITLSWGILLGTSQAVDLLMLKLVDFEHARKPGDHRNSWSVVQCSQTKMSCPSESSDPSRSHSVSSTFHMIWGEKYLHPREWRCGSWCLEHLGTWPWPFFGDFPGVSGRMWRTWGLGKPFFQRSWSAQPLAFGPVGFR